jgi:hypothetical protein
LLFCGATTAAQSVPRRPESLPQIISSGLEAYKQKGADEAVKAWIKGSPVDGSKEAMSQANNLRRVEDFYGAYRTAQMIGVRPLSKNTQIYYFELDYEKGPLFGKFIVYRSGDGWILTSFTFNTDPGVIVPTDLATVAER